MQDYRTLANREAMINKINSHLRDYTKSVIPSPDPAKLMDISRTLELSAFQSTQTKEEYVRYLAERLKLLQSRLTATTNSNNPSTMNITSNPTSTNNSTKSFFASNLDSLAKPTHNLSSPARVKIGLKNSSSTSSSQKESFVEPDPGYKPIPFTEHKILPSSFYSIGETPNPTPEEESAYTQLCTMFDNIEPIVLLRVLRNVGGPSHLELAIDLLLSLDPASISQPAPVSSRPVSQMIDTNAYKNILPKANEILISFSFFKDFRLACNKESTLEYWKSYLWEKTINARNSTRKTMNDYIFCVDYDDYIVDESAKISSIPYVQFCVQNSIEPWFELVDKSHHKLYTVQIGAVIGKPAVWRVSEQEEEGVAFRKEMKKIRYTKYNYRIQLEKDIPNYLPKTFQIRFCISTNFTKTVSCEATQTVGQIFDSLLKSSLHKLKADGKPLEKSHYVLKFKGFEEYLLDESIPLIHIETIRTKLRTRQVIEILLAERLQLPIKDWEKLTDYYELNKIQSKATHVEFTFDSKNEDGSESVFNCKKPFKIKIGKLEKIEQSVQDTFGFKGGTKSVKVFVNVGIYYFDQMLSETKTSEFIYQGGNNPSWNSWIESTYQYCDIPYEAILHIVVLGSTGKKALPLGWVNFRLLNFRNRFSFGLRTLKLWPGKPDPIGTCLDNYQDLDPMGLSVELEFHCSSLYFPDTLKTGGNISSLLTNVPNVPSDDLAKLNKIFDSDPLYVPTQEQRELLWKYRLHCLKHSNKNTILKFVWGIPWNSHLAVKEAHMLLATWPVLQEPTRALELLKPRFIDRKIREYTVKNLQLVSDTELADYLLQLVQALKHEIHHDSILARFLLHRALLNRNQIGHYFFWFLKAELDLYEYSERFELLLEAYLGACGSFRQELVKQTSLTDQLTAIAQLIKITQDKKKKSVLETQLSNLKLWPHFQITTNPVLYASSIIIEECKYMESKTSPLWLLFQNVDPLGEPIYAILKAGDDLRQDALTLTMFKVMDKLWLKEGLDLKMIHYRCIATSHEVGWVEVVRNAKTTADIQKEAGGVSEIFNEKTLAKWLKQNNLSDQQYNDAVDNFIRSCAASCVATYVLGIGDRHNDNIMIDKTGHLFHIDFGKFLGNAQMFLAFKRDRAPFVFTPDMAFVMGDKFQMFVDLCCKAYNIVRKNSFLFLNLFGMMLSTGIPELRSEEDLNYLREAFSLDMSNEEAEKKFTKLIFESLNTKATQLNFAIHLLANAKPQ